MSAYPTKIIIGNGDNFFIFDETVILEISASQSGCYLADSFDSAFCKVSILNLSRLDLADFERLQEAYSNRIPLEVYFHGETEELFQTYVIESFKLTENDTVLDIEAYDILYFLNDTFFDKGIMMTNDTFESVVNLVADDCGVETNATRVGGMIAGNRYIPYMSHRDAFISIAEVRATQLRVSKTGVIHYGGTGTPATHTDLNPKLYSVENTRTKNLDVKVSGFAVECYTFNLSPDLIAIAETGDIELTGEEQVITIEYASYPAKVETVAYKTDSSMEILEENLYAERATFKVKGTAGDTGWITLTGYAYKIGMVVKSKGDTSQKSKLIKGNYLCSPNVFNESLLDIYYRSFTKKICYSFEIPMGRIDWLQSLGISTKFELYDHIYQSVEDGVVSTVLTKITRTITPTDERLEFETQS